MGHALACQIVHDHDAAAVGLALKALAIELREQLARVDGAAEQLGRLAQDACPGVHVVRTVVAVHHGDGAARRRGDKIDLWIDLLQRMLQNDHGEDGRTGGDVARARADGVRGRHAGAGVALGRGEHDALGQQALEAGRTGGGQLACRDTGGQDLRQQIAQREGLLRDEAVELFHHAAVIVQRFAVDGEHAGGLADADGVHAGEHIVEISRQRRDVRKLADMRLTGADSMPEVRDRPALRDVEAEQLRQLRRLFARHGVLPGAEGREQIPVLVKGQIAVHHGRDAHCIHGDLAEGAQCRAKAAPGLLEVIGPDAVAEVALPGVVAGGDRAEGLVDQDGLDTGRAEFDTKRMSHIMSPFEPAFSPTEK